jgi:hypothetical protein
MQIRLKGRQMLHGDILSPDTPVAEFVPGLSRQARKDFVNEHTAGLKMLAVYEGLRSMHITDVVKLMQSLEEIFHDYDKQRYENKRDNFGRKEDENA